MSNEFPETVNYGSERYLTSDPLKDDSSDGDQTRLLLRAIVESSDDAIIGSTLGGQITSWSPGAEAMFGYSLKEAIGQQISLIIPSAFAHELGHVNERIRRGESIKHLE